MCLLFACYTRFQAVPPGTSVISMPWNLRSLISHGFAVPASPKGEAFALYCQSGAPLPSLPL